MIWLAVGMALLAGFAAGWVLGIAYGIHREQGRWAPTTPLMTYSDEPRVRVTRGPYDHEVGDDFDG